MDNSIREAKENVIVGLEVIENDMREKNGVPYSTILAFLPTRADTCPYCMVDERDCGICAYGQDFGICDDEDSMWNKFSAMMTDFGDKNGKKNVKYKKEYDETFDGLIDEINSANTIVEFMRAKLNVITFLLGLMTGTTKLKALAVETYGTPPMC